MCWKWWKNRMYLGFFFSNISFIFTEIREKRNCFCWWRANRDTYFHSQFEWCVFFYFFHWNHNLKYTLKVFNTTTKFIGFSSLSAICYCTPYTSNAFAVSTLQFLRFFFFSSCLSLLKSKLSQFPLLSVSKISVFILCIHYTTCSFLRFNSSDNICSFTKILFNSKDLLFAAFFFW